MQIYFYKMQHDVDFFVLLLEIVYEPLGQGTKEK